MRIYPALTIITAFRERRFDAGANALTDGRAQVISSASIPESWTSSGPRISIGSLPVIASQWWAAGHLKFAIAKILSTMVCRARRLP
jgi:hypothetical protein